MITTVFCLPRQKYKMAIIFAVVLFMSTYLLSRNAFILDRYREVGNLVLFDQVAMKRGVDKVVLPAPQMEFAGIKLSPPLSTSLKQLGITKPSPIQQASIASLSSGVSALLHAATGTGKTLAYLLPALKRLLQIPPNEHKPLQIVIIAPTKELALQIAADAKALLGEEEDEG
ncbi:DEAD/DEAH box helicase, partial [archaeon]